MRRAITWFNKTDLSAVHEKALELIETLGFKMEDLELLSQLKKRGAVTDAGSKTVRVPKKVTEFFLSKMPKKITLFAVDPRFDVELGRKRLYRPISGTINIVDDNGTVRRPGLKDAKSISKIVQNLDLMHFNSTAVFPFDVRDDVRDVAGAKVCFENCSKHLLVDILHKKSFETILEMAFAIAGSEESFRKRPFFQVHFPVTSPLRFDGNSCEAVKIAARYKIPIRIGTSPMAGANSPVRLAGTLLLTHTEAMAAAIITQMLNEGCPVYQGSDPSIFDMRFGTLSWGSAEHAKMSARSCELGRRAGLFVSINAFATDSKSADTQAAMEKSMDVLLCALSGADIIGGAGLLEGELAYDIAQLIIDNEIARYVENLTRNIEITAESMSADLLREVGIGGNFLETDQTLGFFRSELEDSELLDRRSRGVWDGTDMYQRAKTIAHRIISDGAEYRLPDKVTGEIEDIYARNRV